jgi:hypothetical protein
MIPQIVKKMTSPLAFKKLFRKPCWLLNNLALELKQCRLNLMKISLRSAENQPTFRSQELEI